jgi:hypothetical protein
MKKRIAELEARRLILLERIEAQRHELAWHAEQLRPKTQVSEWTRRAPQSAANHPLAWLTGLASVFLLLKRRRLLTWLPWLAGGLSMVSRLTRLIRLISELRSLRSGFR